MGWTLVIATLPWTLTGVVGVAVGSVAAVSRRARRVLAREIWGD